MNALHARAIAAPLLLLASAAAFSVRAPSGGASAYGAGGTAIYQAQVVGASAPRGPNRSGAGSVLSETDSVPAGHTGLGPASNASPLARPAGFDLRGQPSVSAELIDRVLSSYGSPMAGEGAQLVALGRKYGIDPAFCLAFFIHESAAGTRGEAVLTHSVGNIRAVGNEPALDGYRYYDTWLQGAEDWYRLISQVYMQQWGLTNVESIIPVYAPTGDGNDPSAYIDNVEQLVSTWRAQSS